MNNNNQEATLQLVKNELAQMLGVGVDDINDDDSLVDDLHLKPNDFTDLLEKLKEKGLDTPDSDISEIDTVSELAFAFE